MAEMVPDKLDPPRATDAPAIPPWVSVVILLFVTFGILYLLPRPAAITVQGWRMFAIFVCTVLALMLRPLPGGAAVLIGVVVTMLTGVLTPAQALAGYSNTAVAGHRCVPVLARGHQQRAGAAPGVVRAEFPGMTDAMTISHATSE